MMPIKRLAKNSKRKTVYERAVSLYPLGLLDALGAALQVKHRPAKPKPKK
jgi:hypothetical protein